MSAWTATKIVISRDGLKIGFTATILKDGKADHNYSEPSVGVPSGVDIGAAITAIIQRHLAAYTAADSAPVSAPDVALPDPPSPAAPDTRPIAVASTFLASKQDDIRQTFLTTETIGLKVEIQDGAGNIVTQFPDILVPIDVDKVDVNGTVLQPAALTVGLQFKSGVATGQLANLPAGRYGVGNQTSTSAARVPQFAIAVVNALVALP
jgi:hypothetical protein